MKTIKTIGTSLTCLTFICGCQTLAVAETSEADAEATQQSTTTAAVEQEETTPSYHPYARDIQILTDWFEGRFDNSEQMWFRADSRSDVEENEWFVRMHVMHRRLDLPQFGEYVYYVEEYIHDDPTQIPRQRFVTFQLDDESGLIRMQQGFFKDKAKVVGGYHDPSIFDSLQPEELFLMSDLDPSGKCDVYWKREGGQFVGSMPEKQCFHVTEEGERKRYYVHDMWLSEDAYWRVDSSLFEDTDKVHVGVPVDDPVQMKRALEYECEGNFRPVGGSFYTSEGVVPIPPFTLHNQGGTAKITRESDGVSYDLLLREKEYPFYEDRPDFLYFSVRPENVQRSLSYTISDIDSRRFGLFNDEHGIQVFCNRPGYKFREELAELDVH